jgi:hypothetical protein
MILFALDVSQLRVSSLSSRLERACEPIANQVELRAPQRVVASNPDPVAEWTDLGQESKASLSVLKLPLPDLQWTPAHEKRFLELAGREATSRLTPEDSAELDGLSQKRRGLKNPRRGEELLWDYEQRQLTRDLISALSRYVTFHSPPGRPSPAES